MYKGVDSLLNKKLDPRVIRTRHSIISAFIDLSEKKDFEDITVKDITEKAMVNRATFYNHFLDKYDLMEKALNEEVAGNLSREAFIDCEDDQSFIIDLFKAVTSFQLQLATTCQRSYQKTIHQLVNDQLFVIHQKQLLTNYPDMNSEESKKVSVIFASALFNLSRVWQSHNIDQTAEDYIANIMPYLLNLMKPAGTTSLA